LLQEIHRIPSVSLHGGDAKRTLSSESTNVNRKRSAEEKRLRDVNGKRRPTTQPRVPVTTPLTQQKTKKTTAGGTDHRILLRKADPTKDPEDDNRRREPQDAYKTKPIEQKTQRTIV
jgi:hypothetical protein